MYPQFTRQTFRHTAHGRTLDPIGECLPSHELIRSFLDDLDRPGAVLNYSRATGAVVIVSPFATIRYEVPNGPQANWLRNLGAYVHNQLPDNPNALNHLPSDAARDILARGQKRGAIILVCDLQNAIMGNEQLEHRLRKLRWLELLALAAISFELAPAPYSPAYDLVDVLDWAYPAAN